MLWVWLAVVTGYDLTQAARTIVLPPELKEVSAVTDVDGDTVACLQDEQGIVYLVHLPSSSVVAKHVFGPDGDYEGLTRAGDDYFVLRSDGQVTQLVRNDGAFSPVATFVLELPNENIEGLGHDERRKVLLISPKDVPKGAKTARDQRHVYGWDLREKKLLPAPILSLSLSAITARATELGAELPKAKKRKKKARPTLKLRFSSIAVHPLTDDYYILSAVDRALLVVDRQGALKMLHIFGEAELPKPEGITFAKNGDMLIASEGVKGAPVMRLYRYVAAN